MVALREQLVHLLDVDAPRGLAAWVRSSPAAQAQAAVRGREAEALPVVEALLAAPTTPARVRRQAVPLLAHLHVVTAPMPSAEAIYSARQRGETFDPHRGRKRAMLALVGDADQEVAITAAVELLAGANPDELPGLRVQLGPLLPALRARRFEDPQVQHALTALGGLPDALAWLQQLASESGPLPPDLEVLLAALDREGHPSAAPALRAIFTRLDAVREPHQPQANALPGGATAWDGETLQALLVLGLHLRLAPAEQAAAATALLAVATPALAAVLVTEVQAPGDRVVGLAAAAAADGALEAVVREAAVKRLARLASDVGDDARMAAIAALQRLRDDGTVGEAARRGLGGAAGARS